MTEQEVSDVMADIRVLSAEAKLWFVQDMVREDRSVLQLPTIKRWIKRNQELVRREAPSLLT